MTGISRDRTMKLNFAVCKPRDQSDRCTLRASENCIRLRTDSLLRRLVAISALLVAIVSRPAACQVDTLTTVVDTRPILGSKTLGAFGYDPVRNAMFIAAFGTDFNVPGNPALAKISDVGATNLIEVLVSQSQMDDYYSDGNWNVTIFTGELGGLLLNPKPIGSTPAYGMAMLADRPLIRTPTGTVLASASKRIYAYNLESASQSPSVNDVFTTRLTLADMQAATGATTTTSNLSRQFAWSGDGQAVYSVDSSAGFGGLWKVGAVSGTAQRILAADMAAGEPAVSTSGGIDRIYFSGVSGTAGVGNPGGIDFITNDGTTTSAPQVAVSVSKLLDFFELSGTMSSQRISSIAFAGGDMYFGLFNTNSATTDSRSRFQGIYRMDAEGRLSKVANRTERAATFTGINQTFDRFQTREIVYTGSAGEFTVTQTLYRELGAKTVAGAIAFKPGDYNRDNVVTSADIDLFRPQVTASGTANIKANVADLKFDMNGNDIVSWKDVQILEQFLDYAAPATLAGRIVPELSIKADTNLDGVVDFADFRIMRDNYAPATGNRAFTVGDSSGDDRVDFADLQPWVNSDGYRSAVVGVGVPATPFNQAEFDAFLATLTPPNVVLDVASGTSTQFQKGYRSIVIAASVTKTGSGALVYDGQNTYTGTTTVAQGSLIVDAAGTFGTSSLVDVRKDATLDVSRVAGGLVVAAGQTISGSGTVVGNVVFGRGSTLSPGATSTAVTLQSGPDLPPIGSLSTEMMVVPEPAAGPLAAAAIAAAIGACVRRRRRTTS